MLTTSSLRVCAMTFVRACFWGCLLALMLSVQPLHPVSAQGDGQTRPNFIVILTDDQNADTIAHMPILQAQLVAQGMRFDRAYTVTPLCCPSRASILRGQYIHNHGVLMNDGKNGGFRKAFKANLESSTLATWLDAAGYRTALLGKYLNGYPDASNPAYVPPGWDEWYAWHTPERDANQYYYGYTFTENGAVVQHGVESQDYMTDFLADKAVEIIQQSAAAQEPFFVYLPVLAPHYPYTPAPRHADLFKDTALPKPPSFNEKNVSDKPKRIREKPRLTSEQITHMTKIYRDQLRTLQAVDEMVGRLVDTLESSSILDSTYIIYLTDNGYHWGTHRLTQGKGDAYVEDIRVPLVIRGPGVSQNTTESRLVATIDLAPTISELAGIVPPSFLDGRSMVPLLTGQDVDWRTTLLVSFGCPRKKDRVQKSCFNELITSRYTYTELRWTGETELYDLVGDPYQLKNLSGSVSSAKLSLFSNRLKRFLKCTGATCRQADTWRVPPIQLDYPRTETPGEEYQ